MNTQRGFTLIELVMVIVILGILAATAIPAMSGLDGDARQAAVDGIAGALGSASAINYAVRTVKSTNGVTVDSCPAVSSALETPLDTTKYTITPATTTTIASGATQTCTVTDNTGGQSATFVAHGIL